MNHMLHMLYSSLLFSFEFHLSFFLGGGGTTTTNSCTFDRKQKIPFFPTLRKETTGAQVDVRLWPLEGNRRHVWADTSGSLTQ